MAWPSKVNLSADHPGFIGSMTDEQRQQPFNISGHEQNMKSFIVKSPAASQDAPNLSLVATIKKGTFTLISDPRGQPKEILSTAFDAVTGTLIQGLENFEASVSVGGVEIYDRDGSTKDALPVKPHIVKIKRNRDSCLGEIFQVMDPAPGQVLDEPFLFVKFEPRPFRKPANGAWTVRLRHTMEIICHRGYVERVKQFFKPPANIESIEAHPVCSIISFLYPIHFYMSCLLDRYGLSRSWNTKNTHYRYVSAFFWSELSNDSRLCSCGNRKYRESRASVHHFVNGLSPTRRRNGSWKSEWLSAEVRYYVFLVRVVHLRYISSSQFRVRETPRLGVHVM